MVEYVLVWRGCASEIEVLKIFPPCLNIFLKLSYTVKHTLRYPIRILYEAWSFNQLALAPQT